MSDKIKTHYRKLFEQHGRDHNAVQYSSKLSQQKRFDILLDIDSQIESIADIGCGLADLYPVFRERHPQGQYFGYDFVEEFIMDAKQRFENDNNANFEHLDILKQTIPSPADYIVLSGMLNNAMPDNKTFTEQTLLKMWQAAQKGIAFNALSSYVDYQDEGLYYQNPLDIFDFCKNNLSRYVTLRHDYDVKDNSVPFEFTIYVLKK